MVQAVAAAGAARKLPTAMPEHVMTLLLLSFRAVEAAMALSTLGSTRETSQRSSLAIRYLSTSHRSCEHMSVLYVCLFECLPCRLIW